MNSDQEFELIAVGGEEDGQGTSLQQCGDEDTAAAGDNGNEVETSSKKRRKVWKYGELVEGGAKCKICGKVYKTATGNTSNLIYHIKSKHRGSPEEKELTKELDDEKKEETKKMKKKEVSKSQTSLLNFVSRSGACAIDAKKHASGGKKAK